MTEMNCSKDGIGAQHGPAGDQENSNTNPRNSATANQKVGKLNMAIPKNYQKIRNLSMQFPSNDIFNEALQQKTANAKLEKKIFQPVLQERKSQPQRKPDASKSCNKPNSKPTAFPNPATTTKPKIIPKELVTTIKKVRELTTVTKSPIQNRTIHKKTASMATQPLADQALALDGFDKYNKPRARKNFDTEEKKRFCHPASKAIQSNRKLVHVKSRLDTG